MRTTLWLGIAASCLACSGSSATTDGGPGTTGATSGTTSGTTSGGSAGEGSGATGGSGATTTGGSSTRGSSGGGPTGGSTGGSATGSTGGSTSGTTTGSSTGGGNGGASTAGAPDAGGGGLAGALIGGTGPYPGPIAGVHFRTPTQSGYTSDAGSFDYLPGETVTFSVAGVDFAPTPGAPYVSLWQLASPQTCHPSSELTDLLVFLYSLDADGTAANGTQITPYPMGTSQQAFSALSAAQVQSLIAELVPGGLDGGVAADGGYPVDGGQAVVDFITQMDDEVWQQIGLTTLTGTTAYYASQGVTTDGTDFYFSFQFGFNKTDLQYNSLATNSSAIPLSISLTDHDDHIGDVDYAASPDGGWIYAGFEDSGLGETTAYTHPRIAQFDTNLNYLQSWPLSTSLMNAGVPWVAVDNPNQQLVIANWSPTPALYLLDLSANYLSTLPLSQQIPDIQGAKMSENHLYTSQLDSRMTIAKVDMDTGVVVTLWHMTDPAYALPSGAEEEGCVFLDMADGSQFHTIDNDASALKVEFRHHQRVRGPLRNLVCP